MMGSSKTQAMAGPTAAEKQTRHSRGAVAQLRMPVTSIGFMLQ